MKKFLKIMAVMLTCVLTIGILALLVPPLVNGDKALLMAVPQLDKPYIFGAVGPDKFDCSGLTQFCYAPQGIELFHGAKEVGYDEQYLTIPYSWALLPGDLVFFDTVSDRDECDHVGIWIGHNRFIHASSSMKKVMISEFDEKWRERYSWAKRITYPEIYSRFFSLFSSDAMD